ncbi:DUF5719 family protein [Nonomuraea sp. NPDC048826]|uniref:DUF5719 family protein n=1 Tax=Nonomuraea sp. NPDC048826 TaxID=3364347 RepID=UPI00371AF5CB
MRRFAAGRFGLIVMVLAALAGLYGVAYVTRPAPEPRAEAQPRKVAVEAATATCPAAGGEEVSVYLPGTLSQEPMKDAEPYTVRGPGGVEAGYVTRTAAGAGRGLAGLRCAEPVAETWLVGPGPARARVTLHLVNADKAPAFADVEVYAAEGPVSGDNGLGLEIAPGEHRQIDLRTLAAAADVMAVSVKTFTGRLAVSARAVLESGGVDWLPPAAAPATEVVVPAIPGGGGRRELLVAALGENDATVRIKAVTEGAAYAMRGRESVDVPAGSVLPLDVTTGIGGESAALVLTSTVPVVAGAVITGTGRQPDVAFTAGTPALDLGSAVAANGPGTRLVLTAPGGAGKVRVQVVPEGGEPRAPVDVTVPAGRTRNVRVAGKGAYAVVVTPVSGRVYGGRVMEERLKSGVLITAQPLAPARLWTVLRPLTDTPRAVLP